MSIAALANKPKRPLAGIETAGFIVGGALLIWSGYIHFHLWNAAGYRHIRIIGPLFMMQSVSAVLLGLAAIITRRVLAAVLGIGFAALTLMGFLISVTRGLFGFKDSWLAPDAHIAFIIELAAFVMLLATTALVLLRNSTDGRCTVESGKPARGGRGVLRSGL
jgi:hypothetical protein